MISDEYFYFIDDSGDLRVDAFDDLFDECFDSALTYTCTRERSGSLDVSIELVYDKLI